MLPSHRCVMKRRIKGQERMRKRRRMTKRLKNRPGPGNDVYLRPVHWIMDDCCLRFLEEEEEEGRWRNMELKRERKERGREKEGKIEKRL